MPKRQSALTYLGSLDDRVALYPFCAITPRRPPRSRGLDWRVIEQAIKGPPGVVEEGFLLHWAALSDPAVRSSPLGIAIAHRHMRVFSRAASFDKLIEERRKRGVTSVQERTFDRVAHQSLAELNRLCADADGFVRFPRRVVDMGTERLLMRALQEQRRALTDAGFSAAELDDFGAAFLQHRAGRGGPGPKTARTAWEDAALQHCAGHPDAAMRVHRLMRMANRARHIHQAACIQAETGVPVAVETGVGIGFQDMLADPPGARRPLQQTFAPLLVPRAALRAGFARVAPSLLVDGGPLAVCKQTWLGAMDTCARSGDTADVEAATDAQRRYEDALWQACGVAEQLRLRRSALKHTASAGASVVQAGMGWALIGSLRSAWRHMVDAPRPPPRSQVLSRRSWLESSVGLVLSIATTGLDSHIEHGLSHLLPNDEADLDEWSQELGAASGRTSFKPSSTVLCISALNADAARRHVQALPAGPVV